MAKQRTGVFFPWERRSNWLSRIGRARLRTLVLAGLGLAMFVLLRAREERHAAIRATRATIYQTYPAVLAYRADHKGACPKDGAELVLGGYASRPPKDAWGHDLRVVCPGLRDKEGFDVLSDGPDGLYYGLDRVE
ncbi:MAG: type II secretion system protein GspG [Polyangiaceae bacterium]